MRLTQRDLVAETRLALKMALASSLSWWLATRAGEPRPIFAALVGLVGMSADPFGALASTAARIAGVFVGVGIGLAILQLDLRLTLVVTIALVAGTLAGIPLRIGERANVQPAVSALFLVGVGRSGALGAGVARLWETAIGAGVTMLVAVLLWPPDPVAEVRYRLDRLRRELAGDLAAVADDLATGSRASLERLDDLRAHSLEAVREVFDLPQARRALRLNPVRRGDAAELAALEASVNLGARAYRHARSIARDVADTGVVDPGLAAATRALAGAADEALSGGDPGPPLAAAAALLGDDEHRGSDARFVAAQLRQLHDDLRDH